MDPKHPIVLLVFSSNFVVLPAQKISASTVVDKPGEGLPSATTVIKGATEGTATHAFGQYCPEVNTENDVLPYSFGGYWVQKAVVGSRSVVGTVSAPGVRELPRVVVVKYGAKAKRDTAGPLSTMDSNGLEKWPIPRLERVPQSSTVVVLIIQSNASAHGVQRAVGKRQPSKNRHQTGSIYYYRAHVMDKHRDNVFTKKIIPLNG